MKKLTLVFTAIVLSLALFSGRGATAQSYPPGYNYYGDETDLLTPDELDDLLAPIALYPDPLIAQILPAATFADQIEQAARYLRRYGRTDRIDYQPWDLSVRAVAHYPDVLFMMDSRLDWTIALGQAFLEQEQDVMDAIQRLRADALEQGNLYSTQQQQVIEEPDSIRIVPATPQYVYVPVYDPDVVYVERYTPGYPVITFSSGLIIGAWLNRDFDWHRHRVYYHGWRGGGWVGRARPHVRDRGGVYINRRAESINLNRGILQHDTHRFRQELRNETVRRHEGGFPTRRPEGEPRPGRVERERHPGAVRPQPEKGRQRPPEPVRQRQPAPAGERPAAAAPRPGVSVLPAPAPTPTPAPTPVTPTPAPAGQRRPEAVRHGRPGTRAPAPAQAPAAVPAQPVTPQPVPATGQPQRERPQREQRQPATGGKAEPSPAPRDVFRGRDVRKAQPASQSGYGGYGSRREAEMYRQRGQASQENMRGIERPAPLQQQRPAAAPRVAPTPRPQSAPRQAPSAAPAPTQMRQERPAPVPRMSAPSAAPRIPAPAAAPGTQAPARPAPQERQQR